MEQLINFAVKLLEKENSIKAIADNMPSQNPDINPSQNADINPSQNPKVNSSQNPDINPSQNPNWKQNQWGLFRKLILWEYLNEDQRKRCKFFLSNL